ncbi:MAG: TIM barrel protein [Thermoleophilia bacterium]
MIRASAHLSTLFADVPAPERPGLAAAAGYRLVESWWPAAEDHDALVAAVEAHGLRVVLVNADCGDVRAGERGFLNVPGREEGELGRIDDALALAARLGGATVHVLVGIDTGEEPRATQLDRAVGTLREAVRRAETAGLDLVLENLNDRDTPGYLLPTCADVARVLERVGSPRLRLLLDAYHVGALGLDVAAEIRRFASLAGHAQWAGVPGRQPPGRGTIPLGRVVELLAAAGYEGPLGLEHAATTREEAALALALAEAPGLVG